MRRVRPRMGGFREDPDWPLVVAYGLGVNSTAMLVEYFSEASRPHTMVLIEEIKDGGYARADEVYAIPAEYRAKD